MAPLPTWLSSQELGPFHVLFSLLAGLCGCWLVAARRRRTKNDGEALFAVILGISTGNPEYRVSKEQAFRHAAGATDPSSPIARVLDRVYNNSRINNRYFCVPDLAAAGANGGGSGLGEELQEDDAAIQAMLAESILAEEEGGGGGTGGGGDVLPRGWQLEGQHRPTIPA
ncbi:unnamed protein product, partial [Ectocarpus sp. 12 AP-2014]